MSDLDEDLTDSKSTRVALGVLLSAYSVVREQVKRRNKALDRFVFEMDI